MGDDEKVPEWLPDGWIVKASRRPSGKVDRYYVSPVSGRTFRSRMEVMRYLNVEKADCLPPVTTECSEEDKPCVTERSEEDKPCVTERSEEDKPCDGEQVKDSPEWLPSGWILELRTRKNGINAGKKYKCYIDPLTGSRCYSKTEVLRYLEMGKHQNSTSKKKKLTDAEPKEKHLCHSPSNQERINEDSKDIASIKEMLTNVEPKKKHLCKSISNRKSINADLKDNIVSLIESSPDGLPPGWIKQVKCKKSASGLRKDPYYIDPVSGYVFRSKKDALRYIESGEISKHAFKQKTKKCANEMFLDYDSPRPISAKRLKGEEGEGAEVKMCLFAGKNRKIRKSNRKSTKKSNELLTEDTCSPPPDRALLQCAQGGGSSYGAPTSHMFLKRKGAEDIHIINLHENEMPDKLLEAAEEEALDQVIEKLLDSVKKNSPGSSDGKLSAPVLQNPSDMEWLGVVCKETMKPADTVLTQSSEPVDKHVEPLPKKQLEFEAAKVEMTSKEMLKSVESACNIRMNPSDEKSQDIGGNKKVELADQGTSTNINKNPVLEDMEEEMEGQVVLSNATRRRKSKAKTEKTAPIARRASKRLAGLEADPAAAIEVSDKSLNRAKQSKSRSARTLDGNHEAEAELTQLKDEPLADHIKTERPKPEDGSLRERVIAEPPKLNDEPLGGQVGLEELGGGSETAYEDPMALPFGDSWPDPCIEFAFKTLTGEIPVLDTATIEGFLHEQLSSVHSPSLDTPSSSVAGGCPDGQDQTGAQMQVNSAGKAHSSLGDNNMSPGTHGKVKRLCRRAVSRKIPAGGK